MRIRRALALTTVQRYLLMAINFATLAALSRILTPQEIGTAAVGTAIALLAISLREFASNQFFVLHRKLTPEDVRGGFTVMLLLTLLISGALAASAPWLAEAFGDRGLRHYLQLLAVTFLVELFGVVIVALMQRDMAFDRMAVVAVASAVLGSAVSIALAAAGFSYMSMAWGWLAAAVASAVVAVCLRPGIGILRPTRTRWRPMLAFGGCNGVVVVLQKAYEQLPYFALGRILPLSAAGIYNRSVSLAQVPQKMVLGGVFNLMLPVLSAQARAGASVKEPYLRAIAYITAVQWPALILLAVLAHPAVAIVLGSQWLEAVPIVQILVLAALFAFCAELNAATLIALGGIRDIMWRSLVTLPVSGAALCAAAGFGLTALALSFFITVPLQELAMFHAVRGRLGFAWRELGAVLRQGAAVAACSALGPLLVVASAGFELPLALTVLAAALSAAGWLAGLWLTRHPLLVELQDAAATIRRHQLVGRAIDLRKSIASRWS
jgi:O-antigen/teichoic acid export membrane protein